MKKKISKAAIMLMGLPGAGKSTQAFRLVSALGDFLHFDTGGEIYRRIYNPHYAEDPLIQEQRRVYEGGFINDPAWVARLVVEQIQRYAAEEKGLVFSGSPRSRDEASEILAAMFAAYGKNVVAIVLKIDEGTAAERARTRAVCSNRACRFPTKVVDVGTPCPHCGTTIPKPAEEERWKIRLLDTRLREYWERTHPVVEKLQELGVVHIVDGEMTEEKVQEEIERILAKL
jgi:adenylate kinase family enzyme